MLYAKFHVAFTVKNKDKNYTYKNGDAQDIGMYYTKLINFLDRELKESAYSSTNRGKAEKKSKYKDAPPSIGQLFKIRRKNIKICSKEPLHKTEFSYLKLFFFVYPQEKRVNIETLNEDSLPRKIENRTCLKCGGDICESILVDNLPPISVVFVNSEEKEIKSLDYPLSGLDLKRMQVAEKQEEPQLYDLLGVCVHRNGNHFIAYCKRSDGWYLFDDLAKKKVKKATPKEVRHQKARLLFYQKRE